MVDNGTASRRLQGMHLLTSCFTMRRTDKIQYLLSQWCSERSGYFEYFDVFSQIIDFDCELQFLGSSDADIQRLLYLIRRELQGLRFLFFLLCAAVGDETATPHNDSSKSDQSWVMIDQSVTNMFHLFRYQRCYAKFGFVFVFDVLVGYRPVMYM